MILKDRDGKEICIVNESDLLFSSEARKIRIYRAISATDGKIKLLKVPFNKLDNNLIQNEANFLRFLAEQSDDFERKNKELGNDYELHYDWLFPVLEESFLVGPDQGGRQMNLLSIRDADVKDFVPLAKMFDDYRVDARTSAWMLGRMLKLQTFIEQCRASFCAHRDYIVFEPKEHRLVYLNWIDASINPRTLGDNVASLAESVACFTCWTNWYSEEEGLEYDPDRFENEKKQLKCYNFLAEYPELDAVEAHRMLYETLDSVWGRSYHPFTYIKSSEKIWHSLEPDEDFYP